MVDQYPFGLGTQPSSRSIDREGRQTYAQLGLARSQA